MRRSRKGGLPEGWVDERNAYAVARDQKGAHLCVRAPDGTPFLKLPLAPALNENFSIEGKMIVYKFGAQSSQALTIRLEDGKKKVVHTVLVGFVSANSAYPVVRIADKAPVAVQEEVWNGTGVSGRTNQFCLKRKGKTLQVSVNGENHVIASENLEEAAEYDTLWIGMAPGNASTSLNWYARLYSLEVRSLAP